MHVVLESVKERLPCFVFSSTNRVRLLALRVLDPHSSIPGPSPLTHWRPSATAAPCRALSNNFRPRKLLMPTWLPEPGS